MRIHRTVLLTSLVCMTACKEKSNDRLEMALVENHLAQAATGVCDSNPPTTTQACIDAVQQASGGVVNDIFRDSNGRTGPQLPVFGHLFNQYPGCDSTSFAGCAGESLAPYNCPGQYRCNAVPNTFAYASAYLNGLDHLWWHPARITDHAVTNGCPNWASITPDGLGGNYLPWEGLVFDLGGPSNKVAIFAVNDHGPQPCESLEYTVYLSDNPLSHELIQRPAQDGVDPNKWNRAVLSKVFTGGWMTTRNPDPAAFGGCGDTANYAVEDDSFSQVFELPCGITFRYAAIIAGNDGLDFPACAFDSNEAELDAVAGLTESGAGVCPDVDEDGFVNCTCAGAPSVCDCNDSDPAIHPGALESCNDSDLNCDGVIGMCGARQACHDGICVDRCPNELCRAGATCAQTDDGPLCIPRDCTQGACPPGTTCDVTSLTCVPACTGVVCPSGEVCRDGNCVDPCLGKVCPNGWQCVGGSCQLPCSCFAGDVGCAGQSGAVCNRNSNLCTTPACAAANCQPGTTCDPSTGTCVSRCQGVVCPPDANPCTDEVCDPVTGCGHVTSMDGTACPDSNLCNGTERCMAGSCSGGTPLNCDDSNPCTRDSCDRTLGCVRQSEMDSTPCDDNDLCNGREVCMGGMCNPGITITCGAIDACHAAGTCDPMTGACSNPLLPDAGVCVVTTSSSAASAGTSGNSSSSGVRSSSSTAASATSASSAAGSGGSSASHGAVTSGNAASGSATSMGLVTNSSGAANAISSDSAGGDDGNVRPGGCNCDAGSDDTPAIFLGVMPLLWLVRRRVQRAR